MRAKGYQITWGIDRAPTAERRLVDTWEDVDYFYVAYEWDNPIRLNSHSTAEQLVEQLQITRDTPIRWAMTPYDEIGVKQHETAVKRFFKAVDKACEVSLDISSFTMAPPTDTSTTLKSIERMMHEIIFQERVVEIVCSPRGEPRVLAMLSKDWDFTEGAKPQMHRIPVTVKPEAKNITILLEYGDPIEIDIGEW